MECAPARDAYVTKKTKDHKNCYIFTTFHVYSFYIHSQCDTDTRISSEHEEGDAFNRFDWKYIVLFFGVITDG